MTKMYQTPLIEPRSMLRGFLSGSLIAGGLFNDFGLFIQAILLVAGVFVFLDTILPSGEALHTISVVILAIVGFVLTGILSIWNSAVPYLIFASLVTIIIYFFRFRKREPRGK